eukprot:TRINITY_DN15430_c0_g1_i3.p1 TRINITY_DN15430_c0_g1~~TRINITY_DN15430_c0_g1_i3.p1  ORF type:complete len:436 (-),score=87.60 TRINITY_DN15430_c0_g1_i3:15-1322(-)
MDVLPHDIQRLIFGELDASSLGRAGSVCASTRTAALDNALWRHRVQQDFTFMDSRHPLTPLSVNDRDQLWKGMYHGIAERLHTWKVANRNHLAITYPHKRSITCMSADHRQGIVLTGSADFTASVIPWRTQEKEKQQDDGRPPTKQNNTKLHHKGKISCVKLFDEAQRAATSSYDKLAKIWDCSTGACTATLDGHTNNVKCIDTHGNTAVTCGWDNLVIMWDMRTGQQIAKMKEHIYYVNKVKFVDDGKYIVSCSDDCSAIVWDGRDGRPIHCLAQHTNGVNAAELVMHDKLVTASEDNRLMLWDLNTGTCLQKLTGHSGSVTSLAPTPTGVASGSYDGTVRCWDIPSGECTAVLNKFSDMVSDICVPRDGSIVAASYDKSVRVWDPITRCMLVCFVSHAQSASAVTVVEPEMTGDKHRRLLSTGHDGQFRVWTI